MLPGRAGENPRPAARATERVAMPQSARPARTASATSAPVTQGGDSAFSRSRLSPARSSSDSSRSCAPAPSVRCAIRALAAATEAMSVSFFGLPGATSNPCSRRAKPITTASCKPGVAAAASILARVVVALEPVQMDGGRHHFAAHQAAQAGFAALGQISETRAAFAQRPFEQRIVAAADDRRRRGLRELLPGDQPGHDPAVERLLSETASGRSPCCRGPRRPPPAHKACARSSADERRPPRW